MWRFLKKLKIELPNGVELSYDLATSLLGVYPEKTIIQRDTYTSVFTSALFATARTSEAT